MTLETEHRALGSMHSTREDNLQSKRPDTLKAQAFERMRYHFQTATWVAVGLLTSLSMATTIASRLSGGLSLNSVSYTHLRAHETDSYLVCRLLLEKKKKKTTRT